jgi:small neutral amino acid transporter SnatA (MarC family)
MGILLVLIFGPSTIQWVHSTGTSEVNVGGLEASLYIWFVVMFITALMLYLALKATVWREY